jgi:hypothetical protein
MLSVAGGQAGTKGQCPHCKKTVTIPAAVPEEAVAQASVAGDQAAAPKASPRDPLLFDIPPADVAGAAQTEEQAAERLRDLRSAYVLKEREEPPERPLPWVIDIFLYPLNKLGLVILLLSTGIPFALRPLLRLSRDLTEAFPPALFLWVPLMIVHWGALLLFVLYINWYLAECIRDSAAGAIRAVDTTASTPGFTELVGQSLTVLACGAACMGPALLYARNHNSAPVFWVLYGVGGFLFPMALLAVTLFESLRALNPVLLLASISSTLVPYSLLALFSYGLYRLPPLMIRNLLSDSWILGYLLLFATFYLALVLAHLLGRFYWKNQEKLNWDT